MPTFERVDGRRLDELRKIAVRKGFQLHPAGSVLIECGRTRVLCAVTITDGVPRWMREQGVPGGWLTAEYQMLPTATAERTPRESSRGRVSGRTQEIQRLVGRSLRCVVDLAKIGSCTLQIDCDVIDADGGTRCASITGACIAAELALRQLFVDGRISTWPMIERVAAVSVGMVDGTVLLDLDYAEDSAADVDMNVVMTEGGRFVEVQGTAEGKPFTQSQMEKMLAAARKGLAEIFEVQRLAVK